MVHKKLPSQNKNIDRFINTISTFFENSAGTNRGELQTWSEDNNAVIKKAHLALKKEQEICTINRPLQTQKINTFFYPPKLIESLHDKQYELIDLINNLPTGGILISGKLGQGKSMLLRYLQFIELNLGVTIPIFLDLKKIQQGNQIIDNALAKMNSIGLNSSKKLFEFLLKNGKITLFLDGYDEIQFDKRPLFNESISSLISKIGSARVFITSRHDTEVEKIPSLNKYKVSVLNSNDYVPFIKKILKDDPDVNTIASKIDETKEFDASVLDTPLLLSWFIMVFKVRRKIPKTRIGFYEELFKTILSRHDGIKDSLNRPSKSHLSDDDIEIILHAFCYITSKNTERDFDDKKINQYITQAINITNIPGVKANDYLYDLTHITCLLVKDGMSYGFIHDSIQSYFSACFIKGTNEENSKLFYKKAELDRRTWKDELSFLAHLDSYRFRKFLVFPSIAKVVNVNVDSLIKTEKVKTLDSEILKEIYSKSVIYFKKIDGLKWTYVHTLYYPTDSYTCHLILNDGTFELCDVDRLINRFVISLVKSNKDILQEIISSFIDSDTSELACNVPLLKVLNHLKKVQAFCNFVHDETLDLFNDSLKDSLAIIRSEESKEGLF